MIGGTRGALVRSKVGGACVCRVSGTQTQPHTRLLPAARAWSVHVPFRCFSTLRRTGRVLTQDAGQIRIAFERGYGGVQKEVYEVYVGAPKSDTRHAVRGNMHVQRVGR